MDPASHNRQQGQFQRKGEQHLQDDIPRGVHDILADDGVRKLAGKDEGRYHQITDQQVLAPRMEIRPGTLVVETGYRHRGYKFQQEQEHVSADYEQGLRVHVERGGYDAGHIRQQIIERTADRIEQHAGNVHYRHVAELFLELCDYRLLEHVGHIIDLSAESGLQIVHQFAEHRFQGFQQHGEQCDGGYAEYILPHQVHVILHGGRAVLVGLHLPVYRIQTVDERDSHESRHYRIEGFHGDVPPDTFISIVDMLDRYFCY